MFRYDAESFVEQTISGVITNLPIDGDVEIRLLAVLLDDQFNELQFLPLESETFDAPGGFSVSLSGEKQTPAYWQTRKVAHPSLAWIRLGFQVLRGDIGDGVIVCNAWRRDYSRTAAPALQDAIAQSNTALASATANLETLLAAEVAAEQAVREAQIELERVERLAAVGELENADDELEQARLALAVATSAEILAEQQAREAADALEAAQREADIAVERALREAEQALLVSEAVFNSEVATLVQANQAEAALREALAARVNDAETSVAVNAGALAALDGQLLAFFGVRVGPDGRTRFELIDGTEIGSIIELEADQIRLRGDVLIENSVGTLRLINGAVNDVVSNQSSQSVALQNGVWRTLLSRQINVPSDIQAVRVEGLAELEYTRTSTGGSIPARPQMRILRNGGQIRRRAMPTTISNQVGSQAGTATTLLADGQVFELDNPNAGNTTYALQVLLFSQNSNVANPGNAISSDLFITTIKR